MTKVTKVVHCRPHLDHYGTTKSRSLDLPSQYGLCETDVDIGMDVKPISLKHITVLDLQTSAE